MSEIRENGKYRGHEDNRAERGKEIAYYSWSLAATRIREIEKRAYTNYDCIYKELANLQENLERLQRKERKL
jgi:hypothetical protein